MDRSAFASAAGVSGTPAPVALTEAGALHTIPRIGANGRHPDGRQVTAPLV
jgi:hypothetical protein